MRRALLIGLALLVLVPALLLTWLLNSEGALRWVYRTAAPAELSVAELSGVLAGPIVLKGLKYQDAGQTLSARQIDLDWSPWALLKAEIGVESLHIHGLEILLPETPTSTDSQQASSGLPTITLPLNLRVEDALIDDIQVTRGGMSYPLNQVRLGLRAHDNSVKIKFLDIDSEALGASIAGEFSPHGNFAHDLRFSWQTNLPSGAGLSGAGRINGDLSTTQLIQQLQGAISLTQSLEVRNLLDKPGWQSEIDVSEFDTASIDPGLPALKGSLQATASGDLHSARLTGSTRAETPRLGSFEASFVLDSLDGERSFEGMRIESLRVSALDGEIAVSGEVGWIPALHWAADVTTTGVNPAGLFPEWPGRISTRIKTRGAIENDALVASASISDFEGNLRNYPLSLQGDLKWQNQGLDIGRVDLTSGEARISASGRVAETLALTWSLDSRDLAEIYPDARGSLKASGSLHGSRAAPMIEASFNGQSLSLPGYRVGAVEGNVKLDLFELQQLDIQLAARAAMIQGQAIETLEINADSRSIRASVVAAQASAQIELEGKADGESWRGKLVKAAIQTADYSDWSLAAPAAISLSQEASSATGVCLRSLRKAEVCGSLQGGQPHWKVDLDVSRLPLQMLDRWTPAELKAEGLANASARLDYHHPARLLGNIDIELTQGAVIYNLQQDKPLHLDYRTGRFELQLTQTGIQANALVTLVNGDRLHGKASLPDANPMTFSPDRQGLQGEVAISLRDLGIADAMIDEIDQLYGVANIAITLAGTVSQPRLHGTASLSDAGLRIPRLDVVLRQLNIDANSDTSENLVFRADALIGSGKLELRGNTVLDAASGWPTQVVIDSKDIDIAGLPGAWLPPEVDIKGLIDTTASLQYRAPDQLQGELKITSNKGSLVYPLLEGEIEQLEYRDIEFKLVMNDIGIQTSGAATVGNDSQFKATLNLPQARPLALDLNTQKLVGSARLDFRELAIIEALVPEIDKPRGNIVVELDVAGTLAQPKIQAGARISDAAVAIPRLGLSIDQIKLRGTTDSDDRFNFVLSAHSGEGQLQIEGNSLLDASQGWPTRFSIKGENFQASRIPEASVNISPDLMVQLHHRSIDIQGDLLVPYAKLQPRDFTTAARVSNDTIIIGGEKKADPKWTITSRINLILGDRVSFFGYGFEGRLAGKLLITEEPGQLTSGSGEISIPEGRYRAYGQRLDIENGRVLFSGGPVTNPGLDVRATRTSNGVIAGLQVRGSLRNPQVDLFSIPAMGQTDTLSYLLFGRPMETSSSEDGAVMAQAALALGLSGGDRLARTIGDRFGLDEMRVESSDSGDQASLVVGRYLSPRLYVSYGVGLIESINTLNLRYQISEKWQLEAESGADQGADFLYTIER